jgi:hypothetical protein
LIDSPEINKVIRKLLSPTLKENGFSKVNTRNNWGWHGDCIWVLNLTAVGKYFSDVTRWPSMSIHVNIGIYYDFVPPREDDKIKLGSKGEILPKYYDCHLQKELYCNLDQSKYTKRLPNPAERERNDIWWIQPDGSNINKVLEDIRESFLNDGLTWLRKYTDVRTAFSEIEKEHDSYLKFYKIRYFAEHLNDNEKLEEYNKLFEQEKKRIDMLFN